MTRGVVVTGSGTGVGKTVVSALLLAALAQRFPRTPRRYWKPYQTGCPPDDDAAEVARLARLSPVEVVPGIARLPMPASPAEAAQAAGVDLSPPPDLPAVPDDAVLVVEGAGGLLVPVAGSTTLADLFARWRLPLVVATSPVVGTINATLLTLAEAARRGLHVVACVVSGEPTEFVRRTIGGVVVPRLRRLDPDTLAEAARAALLDPAFARIVDRMTGMAVVAPVGTSSRPAGAALLARDREVVWHPYTQHGLSRPVLPVVGAEGAWLELADGRRVLDGISSWWTTLFGHGRPEIAAAIGAQARRLDHVQFAGATHEPAVALAERLLARAPPGLARVFYSDDGSTAVETALKASLAFHARRGDRARTRFVALEEGYHGDTAGAMSVSADSPFTRDFDALRTNVTRVPAPVRGRGVAECVAVLRETLDREGDRVAAMVVEPLLMGAAGMLVQPREWVRAVREETTKRGILLVADEVLTGFGRTGALFACERAGITPDFLCLSKALTGGVLPLAATLSTASVFGAFASEDPGDAFLHGHSFTGNPIACAAALASLSLLTDEVLGRAAAIGERIAGRLAAQRRRPGVRDVRGIGLAQAVELADPAGRGYLAGVGARMAAVALEHGVFLRPLGTVLYALPPLCTTDAEADRIADAMVAAVDAVLPTA